MARVASYYIQEERVQIVHGTRKGGVVHVDDARNVPFDELDDHIRRERVRDIVVSCDFSSASQENLHIPPVAKRLVRPLLISKLRKTRAPTGDYTLVSFRTEEKTVEGNRLDEYFVFSVETEEIDTLLERFLSRKKEVVHLYPEMLAVLKILPESATPYLFLYEGGGRKHFFLIRAGAVLFTRSVQALNEGISDYDIQNINMTVSYCRQTPGLAPEKVLCLGTPDLLEGTTVEPAVPVAFLDIPDDVDAPRDVFGDFLVPIAAARRATVPDIFSDGYRRLRAMLRVVRRSSALFVGASLVMLLALMLNLNHFRSLQQVMIAQRSDSGELQTLLNRYNEARARLGHAEKLVRFMLTRSEDPSAARLLRNLGRLRDPNLDVRNFQINKSDATLHFEFEGTAEAAGLFRKQQDVDRAITTVRGIPEIGDVEGNLSVKEGRFRISGDYPKDG